MSDNINEVLSEIEIVYKATDEVLNSWVGSGNMQFPELFAKLAASMNWTEKQTREHDPIVRFYIRRHKDWHVTRGAYGGIMRISDKQKKDSVKSIKDSVKKQMQEELTAKIAEMTAKPTSLSDSSEDDLEDLIKDSAVDSYEDLAG